MISLIFWGFYLVHAFYFACTYPRKFVKIGLLYMWYRYSCVNLKFLLISNNTVVFTKCNFLDNIASICLLPYKRLNFSTSPHLSTPQSFFLGGGMDLVWNHSMAQLYYLPRCFTASISRVEVNDIVSFPLSLCSFT